MMMNPDVLLELTFEWIVTIVLVIFMICLAVRTVCDILDIKIKLPWEKEEEDDES